MTLRPLRLATLVVVACVSPGTLGAQDVPALDELIRATNGAHNALLVLEDLDEMRIDECRATYRALAATAWTDLEQGQQDTGTPEP